MARNWSAPGPRLYTGESSAGEVYLRDHFERFVVPNCLAGRSPDTLKEYRTTISYWEACHCGLGRPPKQPSRRKEWEQRRDKLRFGKRGDPLLPDVWEQGKQAIRVFEQWLAVHVPASNTRRKHHQNLQFLLDRAGPKRKRNVETAELFDEQAPEVSLPELIIRDVVDQFTLRELAWFLDACEVAQWKKKALPMDAATFLRNLALFDYNVGLRIGELLEAKHSWRQEDEYGSWLAIPAAARKGGKRGLMVYLNKPALAIVERMRSLGTERIFPYPCGEGHLEKVRREILAASRIPVERHEQLGFHALRKACGTQLAKINRMASELQLGHGSGRNVTITHYIHRATVLPEACEQLPQPRWDGRQRRLF